MSIQVNEVMRFEALGEQYLQAVQTKLDYRAVTAVAVPVQECLSDLISLYRRWVLNYQSEHLNIYRYRLKLYTSPSLVGGNVRLRYKESIEIDGVPGTDSGQKSDTPLPTFVAVSARKIGGGDTFKLVEGDTALTGPAVPDQKYTGGWRIGGLTEGQTQNAQGNKLSTVVDFLQGWRTAVAQFISPSFRVGVVGENYTLRLMVPSLYGPSVAAGVRGPARVSGSFLNIHFRDVTQIAVSQFVGSQITRKQRERFQ